MTSFDPRKLITLCDNTVLIVGFIVVFATALRIIHLAANPLWLDEAWTLYAAMAPWGKVPLLDVHPPVFYWLVKLSITAFGISEVTVRLPALIFGIIDIPLMFFFSRAYARSTWSGIFATALLAVSSVHFYFSQEARSYTLWIAAWLVFMILYMRALQIESPHFWDWGYVGVAAGAMMWCHYWSMIPLGILFIYAVYRYRERVLSGVLSFLIVIFPLIPILVRSISIKSSEGWTLIYTWKNLLPQTWSFYFGGNTGLAFVAGLLVILGIYIMLEMDRKKFEWTILLIVVSFIIGIVNVTWFMVLPKYFLYLLPFFLSLIGLSLFSIGQGMAQRAGVWVIPFLLIVSTIAFSTPLWPMYAEQNRGEWYDHDRQLTNLTGGGEVALLGNPGLVTLWDMYYHGNVRLFINHKDLQEILTTNPNGTYVFVPEIPVPAGMVEAETINSFLIANGTFIGNYRGNDGYYVPRQPQMYNDYSGIMAYEYVYNGVNVTIRRV